jgi:DNA-binding NtrC family response regulator
MSALVENRFARDARGVLFDLATGVDAKEHARDTLGRMGEASAVDQLVQETLDVLDEGGTPHLHVLAIGNTGPCESAAGGAEICVADGVARRGFVPISMAGLRRLPVPSVLARRSAFVMAHRTVPCEADPDVEASALLVALPALGARPAAVVTTDHGTGTRTSASGEPKWLVAERGLLTQVEGERAGARARRRLAAVCGYHRRRADGPGYLEACLSLAASELDGDAPARAARIAHDACAWRGWWAHPRRLTPDVVARALALLDVEMAARLWSSTADTTHHEVRLHAGIWAARALRLPDVELRLQTHLVTIERRRGHLERARRHLGSCWTAVARPESELNGLREALWVALGQDQWREAGHAAQRLRQIADGASADRVRALAALELAIFHTRLGDRQTARTLLAERRTWLMRARGCERVRYECVQHIVDAPSRVRSHAAGARRVEGRRTVPGAEAHGRADPWRALRRDYLALHRASTNGNGQGRESPMDDVLELLRACHDAEDDQGGLGRMCLLVRERLGALAVGVWAPPHQEPLAGVGPGRQWPISLAERARTTGLPHGPEPCGNAVEAAWPVTHAGTPIGALACRWLPDQPIDRARIEVLLSAAAAACVPLVRGTIDTKGQTLPVQPAFGLVGDSEAMRDVRSGIQRVAMAPFHVLIEGESGCGKELVARAIHDTSSRRHKRFCAVNCAALTDELLEAELFGHSRGAFTGALAERAGLFEEASGGTLFLDEVADLSPRGQAKVLRVLQDGEVRRVGENVSRRVDVRIVAATNKALRDEVVHGRFRQDLRYRLDVLRLTLPPLRERRGDIALLAAHFWKEAATRVGSRAVLDATVLDVLARHDWPGNVRELQNVIATVAVHAPARGRVTTSALPRAMQTPEEQAPAATLEEARRRFEAQYVRNALLHAGGCRAKAARSLGLTRQGLSKVVARLGLVEDALSSP